MSADPIDEHDKDAPAEEGAVASLRDARRRFERDYILTVLEQQDWSIAGTARALGLQRPNLYRKARQLSIPLKRGEALE